MSSYLITKLCFIQCSWKQLSQKKLIVSEGTLRHCGLVESVRTWDEQVASSIPGSVEYISYPMFIDPTITWVPSWFSG